MPVQAGTLRSALHCLSYITAAVNPAEWAPALRPFTLLLRYSTDARPKVRKRAQYGLVDVLAALQGSPALQGASDAVLKGQFSLLTSVFCLYAHAIRLSVFCDLLALNPYLCSLE